jgi:hypothetical protein
MKRIMGKKQSGVERTREPHWVEGHRQTRKQGGFRAGRARGRQELEEEEEKVESRIKNTAQ